MMAGKPRVAVISGFGINCELETMAVFEMAGASADRIHVNRLVGGEVSLEDYQIMAVPGGFSFGDHLGSGRLLGNRLRFGLREQVLEFVRAGKPVIGICNGFQVLTEAGLLPGALQKNSGLKFLCQPTVLRVETSASILTGRVPVGTELSVPINHFEGNYTCDDETLARLRDEDRIVLRYVDNPNGSVYDIAGVCNEGRNVVGLMPHPERACDELLGSADGAVLIGSLLDAA